MNWVNNRYWWQASRPRFWIYLVGPALLGAAAGFAPELLATGRWSVLVGLVVVLGWLSWPFNLFLYGVNDLYDTDTDRVNVKKQKKEVRLAAARWQAMRRVVILLGCISLLAGWWLPLPARIAWLALLFLSWSYSAPPLRWKARPWLDAYSNVLYALPAWVSFGILTRSALDSRWLGVGLFWAAAMHTFSAIPDINADRRAGISTTAVFLGRKRSLWFVLSNWLVATGLAVVLAGWSGLVLGVYPLFALFVLNGLIKLERAYWWFPWINAGVGFIAFWLILLVRFASF